MCPPSCFTGAHHSSHCVQLTVSLLPSSSSSSSSFSFSPNLTWLNPWTVITSLATTPLVTEGPIILFLLFSSLSSGTTGSGKGPCSIVLCIRYLAWDTSRARGSPLPPSPWQHCPSILGELWEPTSVRSATLGHAYIRVYCNPSSPHYNGRHNTSSQMNETNTMLSHVTKEVCWWQCNFPLTLGWS